jgi:hypothetical protein
MCAAVENTDMRRVTPWAVRLASLVVCLTLFACGGGGGSALAPMPPPGQPQPTPQPSPTATPTAVPGNGLPLTGPPVGPNGAWGPPAVANALQFPVQSGYNGSGQTVAIVMDAYYVSGDVQQYTSYFQIPATGRSISSEAVNGGPKGTADQGEADLDVETVAGLAPGANIILYGIPSLTQQNFNDAINQIISDGKAAIISYSAAGCEYPGVTSDSILQQAAQAGIAVVAASGDQGNECYTGGTPQVGVGYPASDPNVTGAGGTETYPPYTLTSRTVWNDNTCSSGQCAGGGGVSAYFTIPTYQQGVSGSPASTTMRNVPDISMPAEYDAIYSAGSWGAVAGTSWSAPQYAALMAEIYEYCNVRFIPPTAVPYKVFSLSPSAFIDVVNGNDRFGNSTPYYTAETGYDSASGIGVPLGMPFANTICPNRVPLSVALAAPVAMNQPARPLALDVTPRVFGLSDIGRRAPNAPTRIQILLRPAAGGAAAEMTVIKTLQRSGFVIVETFPNHLIVDAQGPSLAVERLFATQMHDVLQAPYGIRYMPVTRAILPAPLAPYVAGLVLDDVVTMRRVSRPGG